MAWFVSGAYSGSGSVPLSRMPDDSRTSAEIVKYSDSARAGVPLELGCLPNELYLRKPRKVLSHLTMACDGIPIVSKELRTLVEKWEPTPTIFHPVSLRKSKTGPVIDEYYFMNLVGPVDAIVFGSGNHVEHSFLEDGRYCFNYSQIPELEFHVKKSRVGRRHVWLDIGQVVAKGFFISEAFAAELERLGIHTIERIAPCVEV